MINLRNLLFGFGVIFLLFSVNIFGLNVAVNGGTPYTGFCDDYLLHFSDEDPSVGQNSHYYIDRLDYWGSRGYNTMRLGFNFGVGVHSTYVEWKMDEVLNFFSSHGYLSILDMHDNSAGIYGQTFVNNWLSIASHYKGDTRIAGFNIANEPDDDYGVSSSPVGTINSNYQLTKLFVYLTREIRKIDPSRIVFFPSYCMYRPDITAQTWYSWISQAGSELGYDIIHDSRVIWDISHPYYMENGWCYDITLGRLRTPEEMVVFFENRDFEPTITLFGASRCWMGESFAWCGLTPDDGYLNDADSNNDYMHVAPHEASYDLQYRWEKGIINLCVKYSIPFQVGWSLAGSGKYTVNSAAMEDSNYEGIYNPPEPTPTVPLLLVEDPNFTLTIIGFGSIGTAIFLNEKKKHQQ